MAKKDVELFVIEKRKNAALNKEWEETSKKGNNLKENEQESFFNKELSPIAKKYGFDFSYNDFCEYKKHNPTPNNDKELSDDELFNVAGGQKIGEDRLICHVGMRSRSKKPEPWWMNNEEKPRRTRRIW